MEIAIPLLAMGGLYIVSNQSKKKENYQNQSQLPNIDIPDVNYPDKSPINDVNEMDLTSMLSSVNKYDSQRAYTDKYFNAQDNKNFTDSYAPLGEGKVANNANSYTSLSGEKVDENYFRHNNMVPYFGSHIRTSAVGASGNESILDNYNGTGSQIIHKKEQSPLFAPGENYQWPLGMPNTTDFERSRMNPSLRMHNVKPFEEQRVAPGIGLGYGTEGAGGYNSGMLDRDDWREKTVDELRVATNPKSSGHNLYGYEGPAISSITKRGEQGVQERHGVDGTFEMGQERYLTTTGVVKGPTQRGEVVEKFVNRPDTTVEYAGVAGYGNSTTYADGEYMPSSRISLGAVPLPVPAAQGMGNITESDYGIKSKYAYPNNRSVNQQDNYFGAVGGTIGAVVAPLLDALRPSRKENTIGSLRPYQNAKPAVSASYMYDPNDKPLPTVRETTSRNNFVGGVQTNQRGGGYEVTNAVANYTTRQETGNFMYVGNSSAGERARDMRSYEAEYNQRNNDNKSASIDRSGRTNAGNMDLYNSDINMAMKPKDAYLKNNRTGAPDGVKETPSISNMGRIVGSQQLYQNIQMDRTEPSVLSQLSGNPYAIPYNYYGSQKS
jgi:hypothetical protein